MAKKASQRSKGSGCLVKRGDIYMARWVRDGKVYTRTTEKSDKKEAAEKMRDFLEPFQHKNDAEKLASIATKIEGAETQAESLLPSLSILNTFKAYIDSSNRPDSGARTMKDYESEFNRFADWMKEHHPEIKELRLVTHEIASSFAGHLGKTLSSCSFNKYLVLLRRIWKVLSKNSEARLKLNPWDDIRPKLLATHSRRELTVEELSKVIASVSGEMRLLFAIGIYSGLRLGDAATLKWGNVDLVRRTIIVTPSKTARRANAKQVKIPIHETLYRLLCDVPQSRRIRFVLPELSSLYLRENTKGADLSKRIHSVFSDCGIKTACTVEGYSRCGVDVGFHSLRHTFVSLSANAGVPMAMVQALVGHSNPAMTRHYLHEDFKSVQAAVYALPDVTGTESVPRENSTDSNLGNILAMLEGLSSAELTKVIKQSTKLKKESAI